MVTDSETNSDFATLGLILFWRYKIELRSFACLGAISLGGRLASELWENCL